MFIRLTMFTAIISITNDSDWGWRCHVSRAPVTCKFLYIYIYTLSIVDDYSCIVIDQIISLCNGYLGVRYEAYYM